MSVSSNSYPLRHSLVFNCLIKPWAVLAAWFAVSLAAPALLAQAPAPSAHPAATAAPAPPAEEQTNAATPGGPHESIKVYGHWVIEVRNPDGSLAQRREFENALQRSAGQAVAAALLLGNAVPAGWEVQLLANPVGSKKNTTPCGNQCILLQQQLGPCSSGCSANLTGSSARPLANGGPLGFNLSGWIQATQDGAISGVQTNLIGCGFQAPISDSLNTTSPAQCAAGPRDNLLSPEFTAATLGSTNCGAKGENSCEITGIQANQMINVSVTITFQ